MPLTRMRELFILELSDIYEAEREILRQLPLMAARSSSDPLREAFEAHDRTTLCHVDRLDEVFGHLDERQDAVCPAGLAVCGERTMRRDRTYPAQVSRPD